MRKMLLLTTAALIFGAAALIAANSAAAVTVSAPDTAKAVANGSGAVAVTYRRRYERDYYGYYGPPAVTYYTRPVYTLVPPPVVYYPAPVIVYPAPVVREYVAPREIYHDDYYFGRRGYYTGW